MKILHAINQLGAAGGAEVSLRAILRGTQDSEFRHGLVLLRHGRNETRDLEGVGIRVFEPEAHLRRYSGWIRHVGRAIRAFQPDLVHTTLFDADLSGRAAAYLARTPCITSLVNTSHSSDAWAAQHVAAWKLRTVRAVDRALARRATRMFHAVSDVVAEDARKTLGIRVPIIVVPRGRDLAGLGGPRTEARRKRARALLRVNEQTRVLLSVGREEPQKDHVTLIYAVTEPELANTDLLVVLAGRSGSASQEIRDAVRDLGVHDRVRLLGERSDVGDLLCAADVFVFPSLYEGLPGALIEAMAMNVPIVASDIAAVREVVGKDAALAGPGDRGGFAHAIRDVLVDREVADVRAQAAAKRFEDRFAMDSVLEQMRTLWRRAIDQPARQRTET